MRRTLIVICLITGAMLAGYPSPGTASADSGLVAASRCRLSPAQKAWEQLVEGPTDKSSTVPTVGTVTGLLLFVDFPDAPATRSPQDTFDLLAPDTSSFYEEVSLGELDLVFEGTDVWYRMPRASTDYEAMSNKFDAYLKSAVGVADPTVDFSNYDMVHLVFSEGSAFRGGGAFLLPPYWQAATNDGVTVKLGSFLSDDPTHRWKGLMHETGHDLGMPDLYDFSAEPISGWQNYLDWRQHFVGGWDPMSRSLSARHFLAWHKWKNGWLDDGQIACVGQGDTEITVSPVETAAGTKAIVVPFSDSEALVLEVRRPIGLDATICDEGALIYTVEAGTHVVFPTGSGPIRVVEAQPSSDASKRTTCADLYNAPFDLAPDEVSSYTHPETGITFELVATDGTDMTVRVNDQHAYVPPKSKFEAARNLALSIRRGRASVEVESWQDACIAGEVRIEKKSSSGWREIAAGTVVNASFSTPIKKKGSYRAVMDATSVETTDASIDCLEAMSPVVRKRR